ncbi:hypothetical protein CEXT_80731 [Caerostris extrusa]|uniref:Uncharacterized protein n=1 Tax=Caerostris extrusa TaxID=172846 RepID=A0AAV4MMB3_CAEEX|nr:hypothetical protein CEXT_80731 [Caerostris extrusa]
MQFMKKCPRLDRCHVKFSATDTWSSITVQYVPRTPSVKEDPDHLALHKVVSPPLGPESKMDMLVVVYGPHVGLLGSG